MESEVEKMQREANLVAQIEKAFGVGLERARMVLDHLNRENAKWRADQRARGIEVDDDVVPVMAYREGDLIPQQVEAIKAGLRAEWEAKQKGTGNE
jgi:hypothetical protein